MISVIMPTIWKAHHYKRMLSILNAHPLIGEILIIDNDTSNTDQEVLKLDKVIHHPQPQNLYVNPSWNLGVKLAKYDRICLYSDDMQFDASCLETVYEYMTPENGMLGFSEDSISEMFDEIFDLGPTSVIEVARSMHYRYGICMFMHKESYYEIPDMYKIYCGDQYIWDKNMQNKKVNYQIADSLALTQMRTSSKLFQDILDQDEANAAMYASSVFDGLELKLGEEPPPEVEVEPQPINEVIRVRR